MVTLTPVPVTDLAPLDALDERFGTAQARRLAPAAQAALLNPKSSRALPRALLEGVTGHLPTTHRPHAQSAMAIAWHGAGLLNQRRRGLARLT